MRVTSPKNLIKRWSRRVFAAGSRALSLGRPSAGNGVRILTYHRIAADDGDPFAVRPGDFVRQMETLARTSAVTGLDTALDGLEAGGASIPRVVVTFDDGTVDFIREAAPVLFRLGIPSVIYVNPSSLGEPGFLGWQDIQELSRAGVEVGSHGMEHVSLGRLPPDEVRRQLLDSRRALEDRLGCDVRALAYPYGTMRDFNPRVMGEVSSAGYRSACTSINGVNGPGSDPMALRRTKIEQGDLGIFPWILDGALDGWALIDTHLSFLQNRYV